MDEAKPKPKGAGSFLAGGLLSLISVQWFVTGELSMWGKNVFLVGTHARITSTLWFVVMLAGPYFYLRRVFPMSRLSGVLLSCGIAAGVAATAVASARLTELASVAIGAGTLLVCTIPGFVTQGVTSDINRQKKFNQNAEQHGGRISSEGAPSAPPNESSP